jgi:hypothetical protein
VQLLRGLLNFAKNDCMRIGTPIYLVESQDLCWKCRKPQRVIALAAARLDDGEDMDTFDGGPMEEPFLFKNVQRLAAPLEQWLAKNAPLFRRHFSKKAGLEYFANHCQNCGANFGDHFLHESGGAFFPINPHDAEHISLVELPFDGEFEIEADWVMGAGDLLLEFAQRR